MKNLAIATILGGYLSACATTETTDDTESTTENALLSTCKVKFAGECRSRLWLNANFAAPTVRAGRAYVSDSGALVVIRYYENGIKDAVALAPVKATAGIDSEAGFRVSKRAIVGYASSGVNVYSYTKTLAGTIKLDPPVHFATSSAPPPREFFGPSTTVETTTSDVIIGGGGVTGMPEAQEQCKQDAFDAYQACIAEADAAVVGGIEIALGTVTLEPVSVVHGAGDVFGSGDAPTAQECVEEFEKTLAEDCGIILTPDTGAGTGTGAGSGNTTTYPNWLVKVLEWLGSDPSHWSHDANGGWTYTP